MDNVVDSYPQIEIERSRLRAEAILSLMKIPDPTEMKPPNPHRGYKYRLGGNPVKQDQLRFELPQAYLNHRMQDARGDNGVIVSVRRNPR